MERWSLKPDLYYWFHQCNFVSLILCYCLLNIYSVSYTDINIPSHPHPQIYDNKFSLLIHYRWPVPLTDTAISISASTMTPHDPPTTHLQSKPSSRSTQPLPREDQHLTPCHLSIQQLPHITRQHQSTPTPASVVKATKSIIPSVVITAIKEIARRPEGSNGRKIH